MDALLCSLGAAYAFRDLLSSNGQRRRRLLTFQEVTDCVLEATASPLGWAFVVGDEPDRRYRHADMRTHCFAAVRPDRTVRVRIRVNRTWKNRHFTAGCHVPLDKDNVRSASEWACHTQPSFSLDTEKESVLMTESEFLADNGLARCNFDGYEPQVLEFVEEAVNPHTITIPAVV